MKTVLVIGGTGSLGKRLVPKLIESGYVSRVRVMSRGEHAQVILEKQFGGNVDWFVGDVRDFQRVVRASKGCDWVINLAAMKSVDKAEYNPNEAVATNIVGCQNVVEACLINKVEKAIFTSTDKAVEPINCYGATKLAAERIFIQSNSYSGKSGTKFSAVRYGNVLNSNGSVLVKWWDSFNRREPINVTDIDMTRFWMLQEEAAQFVFDRIVDASGGEVFIPKMKASTMLALAEAFCEVIGRSEMEIVGRRVGEKQHETLISRNEIHGIYDCKDYYVRFPDKHLFKVEKRGLPVITNLVVLEEGFTSENAERYRHEVLVNVVRRSSEGC